MYKKILVPTDGSEAAEKEVEKVGDLLAEDGEIIILSVASELTPHQFQSKEDIDNLIQILMLQLKFLLVFLQKLLLKLQKKRMLD